MSSDEAMASVYLDNKLVKQTDWKPISRQCWDLKFSLDLDRVRSLLSRSTPKYPNQISTEI